jgi:hypothetical protein
MPEAAMAELVCDDSQDLGLAGLLDKRVVEHHSPRRAEAGDVRVQLRRPAARIGHEHLANGYAGALGKPQHSVAEPGVLERAEAVEDGLEHDGRDEAEQQDEERGSYPGNQRPGGWKRAGAEDETGERRPGQSRADRHTLQAVERVCARRLARKAEAALVQQPQPDGERQLDECREDDDQDAQQKRAEDVRKAVDDPKQILARRRERQHRENGEAEENIGEDHPVARVVVAALAIAAGRVCHAWGVARTHLTCR